ncbi:hypothetical protein C0J52_20380 [Blattella germanica]|nr:hypothetical protein C0J52_20380 [Blattella germanica]
MWYTDVGEIPVASESSSQVTQRSFSRASATSFALRSSVDVLGLWVLDHRLCSYDHLEIDEPNVKLFYGSLLTHHKLHLVYGGFLGFILRKVNV